MPVPAFHLRSPETGIDYHIFVRAPAGSVRAAGRSGKPCPAVLFMDADNQFGAAVDAYRVGHEAGEVPPLLIVGVGYGASYTKPRNRRIRDYTPTAVATESGSGGADAFLEFLAGTLWPELGRRYHVRDDVRGLGGHSLGSLLVLHALFQRRPFFNRLLASAPSIWWDNRSILCAAQNLQRTGIALPARLFLAVGENDTPSMTGDLELLERQFAALPFPQLEVDSRRFPGRDHYNVLPDAFRAGLHALFG